MPISLTISDLHAEFHHLAVTMGYVRASDVPSIASAMQQWGRMAPKHDMQQAEPVAEAEEQPAEKFGPVDSGPLDGNPPAEPEKKPRGRPRKEWPPVAKPGDVPVARFPVHTETFTDGEHSVTRPVKGTYAAPEVTVQDVVVAEVEKAEIPQKAEEPAVYYTLAEVTQALRNIVKAYNYKEEPARQLFKDFGVAKISELPTEKYAAFIAASAERCEAAPK